MEIGGDIIAEGSVKIRERKRWKQRWCAIKKISPVADSLHIYLYKENKDNKEEREHIKTHIVTDYVGLQSRIAVWKEKHVLCLISQKQTIAFAFPNHEVLGDWEKNVKLFLGKDNSFQVILQGGPDTCKIPASKDLKLYIRGEHLTISVACPPKVVRVWHIGQLQRFGAVDGRLVLEVVSDRADAGVYVFECNRDAEVVDCLKNSSQAALAQYHRKAPKRWSRLSLPVQLGLHSSEERLNATNTADLSNKDFQNSQVYADVNFKIYSGKNTEYYYQEPYDAEKRRGSADDILNEINNMPSLSNSINALPRRVAPTILLPHRIKPEGKAKSKFVSSFKFSKNKNGDTLSHKSSKKQVIGCENGESQNTNSQSQSSGISDSQESTQMQTSTNGVNILNNLLHDFKLHHQTVPSHRNVSPVDNGDTVFATVEFSNGSPAGSRSNLNEAQQLRSHSTSSHVHSTTGSSNTRSQSEGNEPLFEELNFPLRAGSSGSDNSRSSLYNIRRGSVGRKSLVEESNKPLHFVDLSKYDGYNGPEASVSYNTIVINPDTCHSNQARRNTFASSTGIGSQKSSSNDGYDNVPGITIPAKGYVNKVTESDGNSAKGGRGACRLSLSSRKHGPVGVANRTARRGSASSQLVNEMLMIPEAGRSINIPSAMEDKSTIPTVSSSPSRLTPASPEEEASPYMEMDFSRKSHLQRSYTLSPTHRNKELHPIKHQHHGRTLSLSSSSGRTGGHGHVHARSSSDTLDTTSNYFEMASPPSRRQLPESSSREGNVRQKTRYQEDYVLMDSKKHPPQDSAYMPMKYDQPKSKSDENQPVKSAFSKWSRSKSMPESRMKSPTIPPNSSKNEDSYLAMAYSCDKQTLDDPKRKLSIDKLRKKSPIDRIKLEEVCGHESSSRSESEVISESEGLNTKTDSDSGTGSDMKKSAALSGSDGERTVAVPFDNLITHTHHSYMNNRIREETNESAGEAEKPQEQNTTLNTAPSKGGNFFTKFIRRNSTRDACRNSFSEGSLLRRKSSKKRKNIKFESSDKITSSQEDMLDETPGIDKLRNTFMTELIMCDTPQDDVVDYFDMETKERQRSASVPGKKWLPSISISESQSESGDKINEEQTAKNKPLAILAPFLPYNTPKDLIISKSSTAINKTQSKNSLEVVEFISSDDSHSLNGNRTGDDSPHVNLSDISMEAKFTSDTGSETGSQNKLKVPSLVRQHSHESDCSTTSLDVSSALSSTSEKQSKCSAELSLPVRHSSMVCYSQLPISEEKVNKDTSAIEKTKHKGNKSDTGVKVLKNTGAVVVTAIEGVTENSGTSTASAVINGSRNGSPARTTLRPRSGKEYQMINRRLLLDPNPIVTRHGNVFTFEKSGSPSRDTCSLPRTPTHLIYSRQSSYPLDSKAVYMNIETGAMSSNSKAMYINIDLTPPDSPGVYYRPEQHSPLLNYAEIDLSGNVTKSRSLKRQNTPTEYAMIDMVATENAQRAAKEHAQTRHESHSDRDTLRRESTAKERKGSSSSSRVFSRDRVPSANSTGSEQ